MKSRRYGDHGAEGAGSANAAMQATLSVLLRLFAPYLPFVTDEAWSWWHTGSVHRRRWPDAGGDRALAAGAGAGADGVLRGGGRGADRDAPHQVGGQGRA